MNRDQKYYLKHRERILDRVKKYNLKNKEKRYAYLKRWKEENEEKVREYARKQYWKNRERNLEAGVSYRKRYPERARAAWTIGNSYKARKIIRPGKCSRCERERQIEAHHEDYSKPLDVIFLCTRCHRRLHAMRRNDNGN